MESGIIVRTPQFVKEIHLFYRYWHNTALTLIVFKKIPLLSNNHNLNPKMMVSNTAEWSWTLGTWKLWKVFNCLICILLNSAVLLYLISPVCFSHEKHYAIFSSHFLSLLFLSLHTKNHPVLPLKVHSVLRSDPIFILISFCNI